MLKDVGALILLRVRAVDVQVVSAPDYASIANTIADTEEMAA
jgi:hypothetical protein